MGPVFIARGALSGTVVALDKANGVRPGRCWSGRTPPRALRWAAEPGAFPLSQHCWRVRGNFQSAAFPLQHPAEGFSPASY